MINERFHQSHGSFTLAELAKISHATLGDKTAESKIITGVAALDEATPDQIAVFHNSQFYGDTLKSTKAGAVIVSARYVDEVPKSCVPLISEEPYRAFALITQALYPGTAVKAGIHPTAIIDPTASLGEGCQVGAYVVVGKKATIGSHTIIGAHSVIEDNVSIGKNCQISSHVTLSYCEIGDHVTINPGTRVGQPGFGFHRDYRAGHVRVPQLGLVIIEDNVMIGSNTTIDRGSLKNTVICRGTMIDNLVQIAHNVHIGRHSVIVAQVGISGSTFLEDSVTVAGQAGLTGHLKIGRGAVIAAQSGVMRDVNPGETVAGSPAILAQQWRRQSVLLQRQLKKKGFVNES